MQWGVEKLVRCIARGEFCDKNAPRIFCCIASERNVRAVFTPVPSKEKSVRKEKEDLGNEDDARASCANISKSGTRNIESWNSAGACCIVRIKATVDQPRFP